MSWHGVSTPVHSTCQWPSLEQYLCNIFWYLWAWGSLGDRLELVSHYQFLHKLLTVSSAYHVLVFLPSVYLPDPHVCSLLTPHTHSVLRFSCFPGPSYFLTFFSPTYLPEFPCTDPLLDCGLPHCSSFLIFLSFLSCQTQCDLHWVVLLGPTITSDKGSYSICLVTKEKKDTRWDCTLFISNGKWFCTSGYISALHAKWVQC